MKKFLALLCVLALLFTLSGCSSKEGKLYEKYEDIITALENQNFDSAVSQIQALQNQSTADNSSELSDMAKDWASKIPGNWIPDENTKKDGKNGFTINADNTCTFEGDIYAWDISSAEGEYVNINLYKDNAKKYLLYIQKNSKTNFMRATFSRYEDEHYASPMNSLYFYENEYEKHEITKDNWQEYFEKAEVITTSENAFGEINEFRVEMLFKLREKYSAINFDLSKCAIEYKSFSVSRDVTVNLDNLSYSLSGDVQNTANNDHTSQLVRMTDENKKENYVFKLGGFNVYEVNKSLTSVTWVPIEHEVIRIEGTLYIVKQ